MGRTKGFVLSEEEKKHLSLYWKGKKKSKEHRENISKSKRGNKNPNFGKSPSKETLEKRSASLKGKVAWNKGKKCPNLVTNWKGGVSSENEIMRHSLENRLWRENVFTRDNWTCQKCKKRGRKLNSHHINNFAEHPELRFIINNGISLCEDCHAAFHKKYGWGCNTNEQIEDYLWTVWNI